MADSENALRPAAAWLELPGKRTHVLTGDCHIGRTAGNEIVNADNRISRRNSVVQREGHHFVLVDLGSTNGTYLNDRRIFKPARLKDRDVIMVGSERYVFRQPEPDGPATDPDASLAHRTQVAVGRMNCWMACATTGLAAATGWKEDVRRALAASGAGVRELPDGMLFAHWREGRSAPEAVRRAILEIGRLALPAGAAFAVHNGPVRVGPAAMPSEENLLGPAVTLTHQMAAAGFALKTGLVLSDAAVQTLGLAETAISLGEHAPPGATAKLPLFALRTK